MSTVSDSPPRDAPLSTSRGRYTQAAIDAAVCLVIAGKSNSWAEIRPAATLLRHNLAQTQNRTQRHRRYRAIHHKENH